jgi:hypothetical protein
MDTMTPGAGSRHRTTHLGFDLTCGGPAAGPVGRAVPVRQGRGTIHRSVSGQSTASPAYHDAQDTVPLSAVPEHVQEK